MKFSFSFVLRQEGLELTLILNLREIPQSGRSGRIAIADSKEMPKAFL